MKPLKLLVIGMMLSFAGFMQAQVSININFGATPRWAPRVQADVRYYYLPDIDAYYDLRNAMFVFSYNGNWVHYRHLPDMYRDYNLNDCRKVAVRNYYGDAPYTYYRERNNDRDRWISQRFDRDNERYGEYRERHPYEGRNWKYDDGRREFKHDNGRGHEQKRGWED